MAKKKQKPRGYRTVAQRQQTRIAVKNVKAETKIKAEELKKRKAQNLAIRRAKTKNQDSALGIQMTKTTRTALNILRKIKHEREQQLKTENKAWLKKRQTIIRQSRKYRAAKRTAERAKKAAKRAKGIKIKARTTRTMEQYLTEVKPQFINRFIKRLHESYADWKPEWDQDVRDVLMSWDYDVIDATLKMLNLDNMYYESQSYSVNTGGNGATVYAYFKQFITGAAA